MTRKEPVSGVALLLDRIRSGGFPWLADRLRREGTFPSTAGGRLAYRLRHPARLLRGSRSQGDRSRESCLFAFYDLAVAPVTFDFLWFLAGADLERRRAGLESVHIVVVPGQKNGLRGERADYEAVVDSSARHARITNIIVPACGFVPSLAGLTIAGSRDAATELALRCPDRIFPKSYEPALPTYPGPGACLEAGRRGETVAILRAPPYDIDGARSWLSTRLDGRLLVTITLRQYGYMPARNSNVAAWVAFAKRLDLTRFFPVFVPDTDPTAERFPESSDFALCPEAAWNLGLRFGLYELAYANLGVNNGPMGLCWLNDRARYITFKMLSESVPQATTEYMQHLGFEIGRSLPFATPWQKWVWEDDTLDVIEREFAAFVQRVDSSSTYATGGNAVSA
jgi:hypothetical protein